MEVDGRGDDECVLPSEAKDYAVCPHGPMLLFAKRKDGRAYYACSASRDRKLCNLFLFADKKAPSAETQKVWKSLIDAENSVDVAASTDARRMKIVKSTPASERVFCKEPACSGFVLSEEMGLHQNHRLMKKVTDRQLRRPMELLSPLEDPKLNAQFVFDDKSVGVVVKILDELKLHRVVCLGAPKIHEALKAKDAFRSYLLDIDSRFYRFYSSQTFARFNMFNAHFFSPSAASAFRDFLASCDAPPAIIVDPPFGGRVQPLFATLRRISALWLEARDFKADQPEAQSSVVVEKGDESLDYLLPVFWAFPYFLENSVRKERPEFRQLDYKVQYKNHPLFQNGKIGNDEDKNKNVNKKGSPIRLLTNVEPALVHLPEPDHKFCSAPECNRWVSRENRHCAKCGSCTSKDGTTYTHCDACQKCVKPSRIHCEKCERCQLPEHFCSAAQVDEKGKVEEEARTNAMEEDVTEETNADERCFNCGNPGHKRRHCPQNWAGGKRKKRGGKNGGGKKARN